MAEFDPDKPFGGVIGSTAELQVLDLLLSVPRHGYNISELARAASMARATADRVVKHLTEWEILRVVEGHGNVTSYWINESSGHIAALRDFHLSTLSRGEAYAAAPASVIATSVTSNLEGLSGVTGPEYPGIANAVVAAANAVSSHSGNLNAYLTPRGVMTSPSVVSRRPMETTAVAAA